MRQHIDKIKNTALIILRGEFPAQIGMVNTLDVCIERLRRIAVLEYVNHGNVQDVNYAVDTIDAIERLRLSMIARNL